MIIGFTGHRPKHLPGNYSNNTYKVLLKTANYILEKYQPTTVISGLALGWDLAVAESAFKKNITVIAAIPFVGQEKKWQKKDQEKYHKLLEKSEQIIVSPGGYSPKKLMIRNQFIVEHSNIIFSLWNGNKQSGTYNAINYALSQGKNVRNFWKVFNTYYSTNH